MRFPAGTVTTKRPGSSQPYNVPWTNLSRWEPSFTFHSGTWQNMDPALMVAMAVVESGGQHYRTGKTTGTRAEVFTRDDGFGDGLSVGIMQVKPNIWQHLLPRADAYTPYGNIALGTAIMADAIRRHGTWQKALTRVYFPANDPNGTTQQMYVDTVKSLLRELAAVQGGNVTDPWRPLPYPPMRDALVIKPAENAGFNRVAFRLPRIVGSCNHITDGDPGGDEVEWYRRFFSTGGERQWDALTDTVIARNGDIGVLNDWRDPNRGGTRAGWANGTTDGIEGDGVAFYRHYPAINDVLVSKEHVARSGQALTDAQMASSIALSAAVAQSVKCPYDTYPYHPGKNGVNIEMMHYLFAPKSCPAQPFIGTHYGALVREVRAILTKHQTGSSNPPSPPPPPPPPLAPTYPFGFSLEAVEFFWGTLNRYDGATFGFDPTGPLSMLWLSRCEVEGKFPEAESWSLFGGRDVVQWEGGWTAVREPGPNVDWAWLDKGAPDPVAGRVE